MKKKILNRKEAQLNILQNALHGLVDASHPDKRDAVIIFTTFGYVSGEVLPLEISAPIDADMSSVEFNKMLLETANQLLEDIADKEKCSIDPIATITVINATIHPYGQSSAIKLPVLNLFSDQIIGYSFGNIV